MRLLNIYNLELGEFTGDSIPSYAVASHRWTDYESTFQEVSKRHNFHCLGFKKIRGFCKFLRDHAKVFKVHWIWIDTCCIDKTSSAELAESINSMFRWYAEATACITYLHDVPFGPRNLSAFTQSVWFKRGWTLQELIAPQLVLFLDERWTILGHKATGRYDSSIWNFGPCLNRQIAESTTIPEEILWDYRNTKDLSIAARLSWMEKRATSRIEDRAYCLLGIFDVNMPLIYGEQDKAMSRLLKKVAKQQTAVFGADLTPVSTTDSTEEQTMSEFAVPSALVHDATLVAVMGMTNLEKTAFSLYLSESVVDVEHEVASESSDLLSVTMREARSSPTPKVLLMDFPGFQNTHPSNVEVLKETAAWLKEMYTQRRHLGGVIHLQPITTEWTSSAQRQFEIFNKLCGPKAMRSVVLATTGWENINKTEGEARERKLVQKYNDYGVTLDANNRLGRFYGNRCTAVELLSKALSTSSDVLLDIQTEMVDKGLDVVQTNAGLQVAHGLKVDRDEAISIREDLREELNEAMEQHDEDTAEQKREQDLDMKRRLEWIERELKGLTIGVQTNQEHKIREILGTA